MHMTVPAKQETRIPVLLRTLLERVKVNLNEEIINVSFAKAAERKDARSNAVILATGSVTIASTLTVCATCARGHTPEANISLV